MTTPDPERSASDPRPADSPAGATPSHEEAGGRPSTAQHLGDTPSSSTASTDAQVSAVRGTTPTPSVGATATHDAPRQAPDDNAWPSVGSVPASSAPSGSAPAEAPAARASGSDVSRAPEADTPRPSPQPSAEANPGPEPRGGAGLGGHLLGIVVGVVLSVFAMVLLLLGQSRILNSPDPTVADGVGIVLVTLAVLLLATVVYLGVWTAALPITGGAVLTVVGGFFLYFPTTARDETLRLLATDASRNTVIYGVIASTMGVIFLVGVLLLAAGCALAVARRRGRAWGAFRERVGAA